MAEIFTVRAPDNFLKQAVADESLVAKDVFMQNQVFFCFFFSLRSF